MPEYDPTNYPKPMADDLTRAEVGRDTTGEQPTHWPSSNLVPEEYAGPTPDREFETSGGPLGGRGRAGRGDPAPTQAPADPGIVPPPGAPQA